MGFKSIDTLATSENVDKLLSLVDQGAGVAIFQQAISSAESA